MNDPWWLITKSMEKFLNEELKKELLPKHILYGKEAIAVAKREDKDEVVFWIKELNRYAVVHLSYSKEASSKFPITYLFTLSELEKYCKNISEFY